ncbi:hypothetical protein BV25DRAFT_1830861 [Artomyces pyxidatus]|uniref:Uncharacterized protein n=1 Tax=Artomyces pyxidatus TaxID=48021 RepID=A0ACB8SM82_9AGAM|nr:hypothetical protein BV25DRAFT_1830861 [Artomyces pyxidatus]
MNVDITDFEMYSAPRHLSFCEPEHTLHDRLWQAFLKSKKPVPATVYAPLSTPPTLQCVDDHSFGELFTLTGPLSLVPKTHKSNCILFIRPGEHRGVHEAVVATDYVVYFVIHTH